MLFDGIFSSDGVIPGTPGFLKPVVDLVHEEGGVYIADEVQPGFCRTGDAFWGFARHGIVPDNRNYGQAHGERHSLLCHGNKEQGPQCVCTG